MTAWGAKRAIRELQSRGQPYAAWCGAGLPPRGTTPGLRNTKAHDTKTLQSRPLPHRGAGIEQGAGTAQAQLEQTIGEGQELGERC